MEDKTWIKDREGKNLKFHRETLLNYAMNRWGLNKAHTVGFTSKLIRRCAPKTYKEWVDYYFEHALWRRGLDENKTKITREYIRSLGQTLYMKLSEVVHKKLSDITKYNKYIAYVYDLFSSKNQTCEGGSTVIETIYDELVDILKLYSLGNTETRYRHGDYRASRLASKRFYLKYSKVLDKELSDITEEECIDYVYNWVLNRTYEKYINRSGTIYNQLEDLLNVKIVVYRDSYSYVPFTYYVDFIIPVKQRQGGKSSLGIQIESISVKSLNNYQWEKMHEDNHKSFTKKFGGKVFFVYSIKSGGKKQIQNIEVIEEIKAEIERLKNL